jgi:excisionase family DNA binding protein
MMTVQEVAAMLRVSAKCVYGLCQKGLLESVKVGNRIRIAKDALDRYLEAQKNGVTQLQPSTPPRLTTPLKRLRLR